MKKFKYRLEPLLRLREHLEKQRQKEHAVAILQVQRQEQHLAEIENARGATMDIQRRYSEVGIAAFRLQMTSRYLLKLKRDSLTGGELLKGLEREAEKRRLRLVEATKQKKIFEKLKERRQEAFYREANSSERKESDEIAGRSYTARARCR
ncbi:MAG: flagellar export protein FliJ [Candidatus Zixiibacteriota bacterium]